MATTKVLRKTDVKPASPQVIRCMLLIGYCLLLSCCGYTIQTRANLPFDTISVGKIENKTLEPKLEDKFNLALSQQFAQYGFGVSSSARYRLDGEIDRFLLVPTTEVNLTATQYKIVLNASFILTDTENGKKIPLIAGSPFITYFPATGRIEFIMAQKELAEVAALTNLSQTLVSNIIYNSPQYFADLLFKPEDISDVEGFIASLRDAKDPVSQYLRQEFPPDLIRQIDAYNLFDYSANALKTTLTTELNVLIQNKYIFDKERFAYVELSDNARQLISQDPQGLDRMRLNRMLLEEAYPDEFVKVLFKPDDLKDAEGLMLKLKEAKDPVSQYLRDQFSLGSLAQVDAYPKLNYPIKELRQKLANELNSIIQNKYIFDERRFEKIRLSDEAGKLINQNPQGVSRMRLNRLLLEESYPEALAKLQQTPEVEKTGK